MKASTKAIRFLESLKIPEGPKAGTPIKLAPFQKKFVRGALEDGVNVAVLSIGRGNAKTALSAGIALGAGMGKWDEQPRREIIIAARTRDQGRIAFDFVVGFIRSLPEEEQALFTVRRSPRLEIEYDGDGGGHFIRVIAADGKSALGSAPTLVLMDERGHWQADQGDALEHALLSGLGKRGGRALIISTSAPDDAHPFSVWLDEDQPGVYRQEHRPAPGLPADDLDSLKLANPGAAHGIGSSLEWLQGQARQSIARGGGTLTSFRLYNRNERVSGETRDLLLTVDEWLSCESDQPPERGGSVVVGIDLGGSASMSAASFYWPDTGRLECLGTFPSKPGLLDRGQTDGVGNRYVLMAERGELSTLGDQTVPVAPWLSEIMGQIEGETIAAICMDRFKQAELGEAIDKAGIRAPLMWRGQGFKDGGEDCERFRRAAYDGKVRTTPSMLLRSAPISEGLNMWPFKRKQDVETRSAMSGFTAELMAARESYISGRRGIAELTGTVQSCVSLWENGFSVADVTGSTFLTRRCLGMAGRSLALRGEAVFLIRETGLVPCSDWDLRTVDGEPRAYRLSISEAGGGRTETALAAEVLHFRVGVDSVTPWAGQAPLKRAQLTAGTLNAVETALSEVYENAPIGSQIVPFPESPDVDMAKIGREFKGSRGKILLRESVAVSAAGGPTPQTDWKPQDVTPDLQKAMTRESLDAARGSIGMVFGVLPALMDKATTGPLVREAQRHLAQWMLQPIAEAMAEECSDKLGSPVELDLMRPLQAYDAGGRARAAMGVVQALAAAKEAGVNPDLAMKIVDWEGEE